MSLHPEIPASPEAPHRDESGRSSFIEILLGAALVGTLVLLSLPWLFATLHRARLTRAAREVRERMETAREQALRLGLRTVVAWESDRQQIVAFVDLDADSIFERDSEYALGAPVPVRSPIELRGPGDPPGGGLHAIVGFPAAPAQALRGAVFQGDGTTALEGAFRISDPRGNVLEIRTFPSPQEPVVVRKWHGGEDQPSNWSESDDPRQPWRWN